MRQKIKKPKPKKITFGLGGVTPNEHGPKAHPGSMYKERKP